VGDGNSDCHVDLWFVKSRNKLSYVGGRCSQY